MAALQTNKLFTSMNSLYSYVCENSSKHFKIQNDNTHKSEAQHNQTVKQANNSNIGYGLKCKNIEKINYYSEILERKITLLYCSKNQLYKKKSYLDNQNI